MSRVGCAIGRVEDADRQQVLAPLYPRYIFQENGVTVEEKLGEINSNGCYYPNGFKIEFTGQQDIYFSVQTLNSLDYSGSVYGPYYEVSSLLGYSRDYIVANGDGTTSVRSTVGIPWNRQQNINIIEWEFYQNGDTPYSASGNLNFSNWVKVGQPIPNGSYLVTYKVPPSDEIHSGYWIASIINAETSPKVKWVFEPLEPDQPPPPPCSITKKVVNPVSGVIDDECDPDVVYPFTVEENCEPPVTVVLEGQTFTLGTNKKKGMDNGYGDVVWGPCSGMTYLPYGTLLFNGASTNYYSDGQGSYYTDGTNPCDPDGTLISENNEPILVQIGGNDFQVGYHYENTVADGNCGTRLEVGTNYLPNGTFVTDYQNDRYYSNGAGNVYACLISGNVISESQSNSTVYITEISSNAIVGTFTRTVYADGICGTYNSDSEITYIINGTQIASGNGYNFFSNGQGGYYSEQIPCDAYGTYLSGTSSDLTIYISEIGSSYTAGSYSESTYADGNCGTYTQTGNSWYMSGTQIASDGSYNYLSDGNGGYYSEPISNCASYGTYISGTSSDVTIYINELGSNYTAGSNYENIYADGNCGTYSESGTEWYPSGMLLINSGGNNYFSNGSGGYYSESDGSGGGGPSCDAYGTYISGSNSDATVYISEVGSNYTVGSYSESTYADGNCGTYTSSGTNWYEYGTYITNGNGYNFYSNGNGGYYSESDGSGGGGGGPSCDAYGTYISGNGGDASVYISELSSSYTAGSYSESTYADGNCGTYTESSTSWYSYGTQIASDGSYNYYSDGNGSYYSQSI